MTESPRHASSDSDVRGMQLAAFLILLAAYHVTFGRFFPTASGIVGSDYALVLPSMLAEYFWFSTHCRAADELASRAETRRHPPADGHRPRCAAGAQHILARVECAAEAHPAVQIIEHFRALVLRVHSLPCRACRNGSRPMAAANPCVGVGRGLRRRDRIEPGAGSHVVRDAERRLRCRPAAPDAATDEPRSRSERARPRLPAPSARSGRRRAA